MFIKIVEVKTSPGYNMTTKPANRANVPKYEYRQSLNKFFLHNPAISIIYIGVEQIEKEKHTIDSPMLLFELFRHN